MKEIFLWKFIESNLKENNSLILTVVADHKKGSPGKQGFKMAVSSNGDTAGSIGGGIMEYNIINECQKLLKKNISISELKTLYHNNRRNTESSGLICSGSQTNISLSIKKKDLKTIKDIRHAFSENSKGIISFSLSGISFIPGKKKLSQFSFEYSRESEWKFEQATGVKNIVYIIGGGHVGAAVCRILYLLDFYIIVYDNRKKLSAFGETACADKAITGAYNNLGKVIEGDSFVVIVTSGFESDKDALIQVIRKNVKYIGLMGTRAKIKKIFSEIRKEGIAKELLKKVHAPIGIDINSGTPEEIAVSIAAEIIKEKNRTC
ncbi:MAG TPA: XdhC family protein [Ignavibacteria bacterium]|nr:XdhC family protein [Ignavibacteria bacterium]